MAHPNEDLVREGYAAFGRGDMAALSSTFFAEGIRWHFPGGSPFGGDTESRIIGGGLPYREGNRWILTV